MQQEVTVTSSDQVAGEDATALAINKFRADIMSLNSVVSTFVKTLDAGETIAGATLPVAVYQDSSDNEIYACDGNDEDKLEFIGFAVSDGTDGNDIDIKFSGIVSGFTGLSEGTKYYIQDDQTIGTIQGTYPVFVGIAISETELIIIKENIGYVPLLLVTSANEFAAANTERTKTFDNSYTKVKEIQVNYDGIINTSWQMKTADGATTAHSKIYINGITYGTIKNSYTSDWESEAENNIHVSAGDYVQLYYETNANVSAVIAVKDFKILASVLPAKDYIVNTD